MFIQTEKTPNPETLKFIPGGVVMKSGTAEFRSDADSGRSPLARRLFKLNGVKTVFLGGDFISVTKDSGHDWVALKTQILAAVMEHFTTNQPIIDDVAVAPLLAAGDGIDDEIVSQICELLETRVRPAVQQDGGDIEFDRFEDGVVYLHMRGACSGCPSSTATLKSGIESMLRHFVPEVQEVRPSDPL